MNAEEKIIRGKVLLQKDNPFFAYILLHMKQQKKNTIPSMGVDFNFNLYYNEEFVSKLSDNDLKFVLCHEVLHVALGHLVRRGNRIGSVWNVACDIVVNDILSNFFYSTLLYEGITAKTLVNYGIVIKDVSKKCAEEIYDELIKHYQENEELRKLIDSWTFDEHISIDGLSEEEKRELERKYGKSIEEIKKDIEDMIKKKVVEANSLCKMKGNISLGIERYFDKLLKTRLNWKSILRRTISDMIPYDFSYKYPSRKSISANVYLPSVQKDKKLEVMCVVDLSASISDEEMREFMTEVYNIAKSFRNIKMYVITHDYTPQDEIEITNGCIDKLLKIKLHGGGGTSHKWLPKLLKEKYPCVRLIVCFTDACTEFPDKNEMTGKEVLWIVSKNEEVSIPFGKVIRLEHD
jgi:predicted metal-dependent peptidase